MTSRLVTGTSPKVCWLGFLLMQFSTDVRRESVGEFESP